MPFLILSTILITHQSCQAQNPINWTAKQLMEPSTLAANLQSNKDIPTIISIGPKAVIPQSIDNGMVNEEEGLNKFKALVKRLPKDKKLVIYCGCCPFDHCPNVRPAIAFLKERKFTNFYLLNIPKNIKTNWIDKGYPVVE